MHLLNQESSGVELLRQFVVPPLTIRSLRSTVHLIPVSRCPASLEFVSGQPHDHALLADAPVAEPL